MMSNSIEKMEGDPGAELGKAADPFVEEDGADDTATESDDDEYDDDENSQYSFEDDHDGRPLPMPPLKYARIVGSLPRDDGTSPASPAALSVKITCSTMGRVVVRPSQNTDKKNESSIMPSSSKHGEKTSKGGNSASEWTDYDDEEADMSLSKVYHVLALGFEDGKVRLVDALTGGSVLFGSSPGDGGAWFVNPSAAKLKGQDSGHQIVALSFDSSSSYLSAFNVNGDAAIFGPLEWGKQSRRAQGGGEGQQKFGFLSSTFGGKGSDETEEDNSKPILRPPFALMTPPSSTVRFTYADPQSFGSSLLGGGTSSPDQAFHPTCLALDPAYGRRKERALIVGFDDGRLILSKLQVSVGIGAGITSLFGGGISNAASGGTAVKKIDSVLYQGMGAASYSGDQAGIEAVTWRGGLVAWADSSGVRLFDIESMARIAHIDRPTGARSSLYPTISSLHPSILFERSDLLLIGWGDCLMSILVRDAQLSTTASKEGTPTKEVKRKMVECVMAWEMDCVACNVVPVDEKHVAVLGLVPSPSSSVEADESHHSSKSNAEGRDYSVAGGDNVLELQIIDRVDGKAISNDRLPLLERPGCRQSSDQRIATANATEFCLLSSFSTARMDNVAEWEALDIAEKEAVKREIGVGQQSNLQQLPDMHFRWKLGKDVCSVGNEIRSEAAEYDDQSVSSDCSVCSDNYLFVLSEPIGDILPDSDLPEKSFPPVMTVVYSYDACLVQTRDVDDVLSYTRSLGKPSLALKHALAHRRDVRRHGLDQLVDEYFCALLRMSSSGKDRPLSFSRLKIAAESLPILLGGDSRMWQRWIFMFSRIPGGLFVIREKIPVRDPDLPGFVFEMSLEKMLEEAINEQDHDKTEHETQSGKEKLLREKMAVLFLETLRSWGPTSALRRRIQLYRYCAQNRQWGLQWYSLPHGAGVAPFIQQTEKDLHRRITQTAFGVLADAHHSPSSIQSNSIRQSIDSSKDSLFDVEHLISRLSVRLQPSDTSKNGSIHNYDIFPGVVLGNTYDNSAVVVESMAELEVMRERFDRALGYYLTIGSHYLTDSISLLEELAVQSVNSFCQNSINSPSVGEQNKFENDKYLHVLPLIELHQLSSVLLKRNYFFSNEEDEASAESPIVALIMLVGLPRVGRFLLDNCSPPEGMSTPTDSDETSFIGSSLPLDLVANQLKSRPKILYWFLFELFIHKPDIYVKFPTTAVPPAAITDLHRIQFSLFVDYADEEGGKTSERNQSSAGLAVHKDTPFMAFLRAVLPHGGVQADHVREKLQRYRGGDARSPVFARELAFVIEQFGRGTIEDAKEVLSLYLRGANNLYMAVAFAERNKSHSSILWDMLVEHCTTPDTANNENQNSALGALFGSLLEAAAHTGSDLGSLVSRIPEGMSIEGLRPKLIAAITDYRYKVKIHEHVDNMLMEDKISVLRELSHISRRGERMECGYEESKLKHRPKSSAGLTETPVLGLLKAQRLKASSGRSHGFSLPMR